jgi:hypothetical protein
VLVQLDDILDLHLKTNSAAMTGVLGTHKGELRAGPAIAERRDLAVLHLHMQDFVLADWI